MAPGPPPRRFWRVLLVLYPIAMAFTLVYSAEHYVTDILIGWALALVLEFTVRRLTRARAGRARTRGGDDVEHADGSAVATGSRSLP